MDPLANLQIFKKIADLRSFSRAAEALQLPRATVSNAVQALEARVGSRLLQRTTRTVQLTPDGDAFYHRCCDVLADFEDLDTMFLADVAHSGGRIRFDVPTALAPMLLARLPEFQAMVPLAVLEMSASDRQVDMVREGFDCVVRGGPLQDSSLVARSLPAAPIYNVASPGYLQRFGTPRSPDDLAAHRLIQFAPTFTSTNGGFDYWSGDRYVTVQMPIGIVVSNTYMLVEACRADMGLLQSPALGMRPLMESGALVQVLPDHRAAPMPVAILYPHRRHLARRVAAFIDWLEGVLRTVEV